MVIHGVLASEGKRKLETQELDMFVSERYLLTIHDDPMSSIQHLKTRAMSDPRIILDPGIDILLYQVLDRLVDAYSPILDDMQDELDDLEESAVTDPTPELLTSIALAPFSDERTTNSPCTTTTGLTQTTTRCQQTRSWQNGARGTGNGTQP
jgi:Mg2+ and Co2+ transporter CorA